jgi:anti-sigma regulatory factor (Ser/Thr protein kinase)
MAMNVCAAFPVTELSQVGEPRRAAQWLSQRVELNETRAGQLALVVTELATNLAKHARNGEILLRALDGPAEPPAIEVLAIDGGPGMPDFALSERDGYSTTGTLGHGLGAIRRQSDDFWVYTQPTGTVIAARVRKEGADRGDGLPLEIGAVCTSMPGEEVCGDAWAWRVRQERLTAIVADGLGHGLGAHDAARQAIATFEADPDAGPQDMLERVHAALRPTRGAAVALLAVDLERGIARYAGLGNIAAAILRDDGSRQSLITHNGIAGHAALKLQEFTYPVPPKSVIVLHSDGLGTQWSLGRYPGLASRHPSVIAGVLYRDFARRRDDVTVVVMRERQRQPR